MKRFEYEITKHAASTFNQLVYFCTATGECNLEEVSADQVKILEDILNERGSSGWELIQVSFGNNGIMAFWKRGLET